MLTRKDRKRITRLKRERRRRDIAAKIDSPGQLLASTAEAQRFSLPDPSLYKTQAELYRRVPSVTVAVEMIGKVMSTSKLKVYELDGEKKIAIDNHPLELLLQNPNPLDSSYEFSTGTSNFRQLAGNAYWWLNKSSEHATPDEIWVLPPHRMMPVPDEKQYLSGYMYDPGNGQEIFLETWEVTHFKRPNPFSDFVGLSAIESLAVTAMGDIEARKWSTRFFDENNGRLEGMMLFADMINDPDWERIKREAKKAAANREQMMLRGVGKGGVDWQQSKATPREMEFLGGLQENSETIWSVLAPGLASMLAINSNQANAKVGEAIFRNHTVWTALMETATKIQKDILPLYGDNLVCEYEDIRISDRALELQEIAAYEKHHTIDEVREKYYMTTPIGDERGALLVAQVSQTSGVEKEEVKEEITATPSNASIEESNPEETVEEPVKSALEIDLDKWKRKSVKRFPDIAPFESKVIPHAIKADILKQLENCRDVDGVRSVFSSALDVQPDAGSEIDGLTKMLDVATPTIVNLTIPAKADMTPQEMADAFALALGNIPAPQVNIEVDPTPIDVTVEAGDVIVPSQEPPVVNVDVNLKQVEKMTTLHKRNKDGDVFRSDTEIE